MKPKGVVARDTVSDEDRRAAHHPSFLSNVSRVTWEIGDRSLELSEGTGFPWPTAEFL